MLPACAPQARTRVWVKRKHYATEALCQHKLKPGFKKKKTQELLMFKKNPGFAKLRGSQNPKPGFAKLRGYATPKPGFAKTGGSLKPGFG